MNAPEWPLAGLDVPALTASGWRPRPCTQFVLKLTSICQFACDHCYVYESADASWATRPRFMSSTVMASTAALLAQHCADHDLKQIEVILHGGEPFLAGRARMAELVDRIRAAVGDGTRVDVAVQTNGGLLDEAMARFCAERSIRVGVSLDGPPAAHDRHRRTRAGRETYTQTVAALSLLSSQQFRPIYGGILCTVDVANDPLEVYRELLRHAPPRVDFLLQHRTWSSPGPALEPGAAARWLIPIFDAWFAQERVVDVRLFDEIIALLLGGASRSDQVGLSPAAMAVIDTDGSLQQLDALKSAYSGAPETGLSVLNDSIDAFLLHPGVVARQIGTHALAEECRQCRLVEVCGGGHYPHRYRQGSGFRNPSVYCADLILLIDHIRSRVTQSVRAWSTVEV